MQDYRQAPLDAADRAMLEFAEKLTCTPAEMQEADLARLKEQGFSEEGIVDIVLVTCMFNFMDRLADALGVELDPALKVFAEKYGIGHP
jgi:uncharacterized peroxidase-related enzyme